MRAPATWAAAHGVRRAAGAAVLLTAVVGLTARALGWGQVVLDSCVPVSGPVGFLGVHLALLRDSAGCPEGTFAVTPGGGVVASVALGTLLVDLVLLGGGVTLAGLVGRAVQAARRAAAAVLAGRPVERTAILPLVRSCPVAGPLRSWVPVRRTHGAHRHRGPPVALA